MELSSTYSSLKSKIDQYLDLARPYNAPAALLPFAIGYWFYTPVAHWQDFVIGIAVVSLLHSALTMQNDLHDLKVDRANHRKTPLTTGKVSVTGLRQVIFYVLLVALFVLSLATFRYSALLWAFFYIFVSWLYNSPPFSGSRKPFASISLLGLIYSVIPLGFGYALSGQSLNATIVIFMLGLAGTRMSVSILKDFKDVKGDRVEGKRTFYLVFGHTAVVMTSLLLSALCYPIVIFVLKHKGLPTTSLILLVLAAAWLFAYRLNLLKTRKLLSLTRIFQQSFVGQNYFECIILLWLIVF